MNRLALLFLILLSGPILAQESLQFKIIQEISIPNVDLISFDNKDNLFASTSSGDIYQFNPAGKQINLYSPERQGRLQQLEAAWTVNIFSFSADLQEYRILDRFLNPLSSSGFQLANISLAKAATLGNNNIVWVWDESDLTLKSLNYLRKLVIQSQPLNLILNSENMEVTEIREFKNRLFMNLPNEGVFIFDNQGNLMKKIDLKISQKLCLYREHLLWVEHGSILAISIANQQIVNLGEIPILEVQAIQIGQERMAFLKDNSIVLTQIAEEIKALR